MFYTARLNSNTKDICFLHIPKTGGTSVRKLLGLTGASIKQTGNNHIPIVTRKGRRYIRKHGCIYTNVRDPFARIVSLHQFSTRSKEMEFKKFFDEWFFNPKKLDWLKSMEEYLMLDGKVPENLTIVKLEEIDEVWPKIIEKHFGKKVLLVPKENATVHDEPMKYFDEGMIKKLKKKEGWVLENFYNSSTPTYSKGVC